MSYECPEMLKKRFPHFEQRWDARNQFDEICVKMQTNENDLKRLLEKVGSDTDTIKFLIKEMNEFRVWSWKEADRDDYFFQCVEDFDRRTFHLLHHMNK